MTDKRPTSRGLLLVSGNMLRAPDALPASRVEAQPPEVARGLCSNLVSFIPSHCPGPISFAGPPVLTIGRCRGGVWVNFPFFVPFCICILLELIAPQSWAASPSTAPCTPERPCTLHSPGDPPLPLPVLSVCRAEAQPQPTPSGPQDLRPSRV